MKLRLASNLHLDEAVLACLYFYFSLPRTEVTWVHDHAWLSICQFCVRFYPPEKYNRNVNLSQIRNKQHTKITI